jgi:hypothetical protein
MNGMRWWNGLKIKDVKNEYQFANCVGVIFLNNAQYKMLYGFQFLLVKAEHS